MNLSSRGNVFTRWALLRPEDSPPTTERHRAGWAGAQQADSSVHLLDHALPPRRSIGVRYWASGVRAAESW